jgi:ribose-phosphate pyrophosphokinase
MKVLLPPSTRHLAACLPMQAGACEFGTFSDGEVRVRVNEDVEGHAVWVIAGTQPPAEHILQLLFLLDALQRRGAKLQRENPCTRYRRVSV